jgi:hypothetical protein
MKPRIDHKGATTHGARTRRICLSSSLRFVRASDSESESRESLRLAVSPQAPGPEPASRSG